MLNSSSEHLCIVCVCRVNTRVSSCMWMCVCVPLEMCRPSQHVCETDDRDEVVVCELCEANVANFNQHMKKSHPGCGRSANRQGYRSNGSYVDGWFGGECGSGNPYYLLCGGCREKYLAIKSKAKVPIVERYAFRIDQCGFCLFSGPMLISILSNHGDDSWHLEPTRFQ